jgi:hypothetical protein
MAEAGETVYRWARGRSAGRASPGIGVFSCWKEAEEREKVMERLHQVQGGGGTALPVSPYSLPNIRLFLAFRVRSMPGFITRFSPFFFLILA